MLYKTILVLIICCTCCGTVSAWTDEVEMQDNETLDYGFGVMMDQSTVETPYQYSDAIMMLEPFSRSSFTSLDASVISYTYTIYRKVWDGNSYVSDPNCNLTMETSVTLSWDSTKETYVLPDNWVEQTTNGYLVKRYFQALINDDDSYCAQFNNSDETDTPDVFYSTVSIDAGDGTTETAEMYTELSEHDENILRNGDATYGFALDGRGAGGGSGGIYEGIDLYAGTGDESGLGSFFILLFWTLIPVIFVLVIFKFIRKIIFTYGGK